MAVTLELAVTFTYRYISVKFRSVYSLTQLCGAQKNVVVVSVGALT